MTPKQQLFCDYYIESLNATESARKAGYSKRTAFRIGAENMQKPAIKAYIDKRMASKTSDIVASQDEILSYLTSILRGTEVETKPMTIGQGDGMQEIVNQKFQVTPKDRIKAAELLGKRYRLWDKDEKPKESMDINIICDIPRPKDL